MKMGCWYSKQDINDRHPNIFKVMNVDEQGQLVSPGQLELTETEMVLYQKGKTSTKWPLAYIRRYGFESELFSFECGRRCPTGPGIYAFRCRRAELLFNLVQERIAVQRVQQDEPHNPQCVMDMCPMPLATCGPPVPLRPMVDSVEGVAFTPTPGEDNNNKRSSLDPSTTEEVTPQYMNVEVSPSPSVEQLDRLYMNVTPGDVSPHVEELLTLVELPTVEEDIHCYANLDIEEVETIRREMVYAVLDLEEQQNNPPQVVTPPQIAEQESPTRVVKGYTVIDFNKTEAVSQIAKPKQDCEGSRKTRHNSTISELSATTMPTRHSSSLSD